MLFSAMTTKTPLFMTILRPIRRTSEWTGDQDPTARRLDSASVVILMAGPSVYSIL